MVRPAAFGYNVETAANNTFQHMPQAGQAEIKAKALQEFDTLVEKLRTEGVDVTVIEDTAHPVKPDAVFPNNWISFHTDGTIATYPMFSPLRRQERNEHIIDQLRERFAVNNIIQFEEFESSNKFLEGTGSMVLDRVHKIAYACISPRTDPEVLNVWCERMGYLPFSFIATFDGQDIYHTNVMMAIGDGLSVVCLDVVEVGKRQALRDHLASFGRDVVVLRAEQIGTFAGNMLAIRNDKGEQLMVMSLSADRSLDAEQRAMIEQHARIVSGDVHTIESIGGGSVRCMIAENFLSHIEI